MKQEKFNNVQAADAASLASSHIANGVTDAVGIASRYALPGECIQKIFELPRQRMTVEAGKRVLRQGLPQRQLILVTAGWVARSDYISAGQRQITDVMLPGDIILPAVSEATDDSENIEALTRSTLYLVDVGGTAQREMLIDIMLRVQDADLKEQRRLLTNVGKRSAVERLTHVLRRLDTRLQDTSRSSGVPNRIPLTQNALADLAGLSLVHTNKSLKIMKQQGLVAVQNGQLMINRLDVEPAKHHGLPVSAGSAE